MKVLKTLLAILVMGVMVATLFGCKAKTDNATTNTQVATVKKGDLSLTITAAGNLALSLTQDLAVDLFYPNGVKGTIGSVLVELGDSVKKDQVLVTLDKDEWNDQLTTLQKTLATAQRNVTTKTTLQTDAERQLALLQRAVTTAQKGITTAQRLVESRKLAVTNAQLNVQSANSTLNQIADVKKAVDAINELDLKLRLAVSGDSAYWASQKANILENLSTAKQYYRDLVGSSSNVTSVIIDVTDDVALQIAQKVYALNQAQSALLDAQTAVDDAISAIDTAQITVDDANYAVTKQQQTLLNAKADLSDANSTLADAQKKLTDAQAKSPEIKAPFDGFVTNVNVSGGDEVLNGTLAVTVADPNRFEAVILVSEMDIMKISLGGDATISLNAITGVKIPAKITRIAPTATISQNVVNYAVKVELDAQAVSRMQQASSTLAATANTTGQPGFPSGNFTPRAGVVSGTGTPSSDSSSSRAASQLSSSVTQNFQLKQGLTGTVDLIVSQKSAVLLVPNNAITRAGTQSSVQVVTANNTTEKRIVTTGLSDWQNTEITSGLSEGEKIIVPKGTTTTTSTTSTSQQRPQSIPFLGR